MKLIIFLAFCALAYAIWIRLLLYLCAQKYREMTDARLQDEYCFLKGLMTKNKFASPHIAQMVKDHFSMASKELQKREYHF